MVFLPVGICGISGRKTRRAGPGHHQASTMSKRCPRPQYRQASKHVPPDNGPLTMRLRYLTAAVQRQKVAGKSPHVHFPQARVKAAGSPRALNLVGGERLQRRGLSTETGSQRASFPFASRNCDDRTRPVYKGSRLPHRRRWCFPLSDSQSPPKWHPSTCNSD